MPMIRTRVNRHISHETEKKLARRLGEAIRLLGKSEEWLMLDFEDESRLYFKGESDRPLAYVEVKLLGKASAEAYERMTAEICRILEDEMGIAPDGVYVYYAETGHWGWNGSNF